MAVDAAVSAITDCSIAPRGVQRGRPGLGEGFEAGLLRGITRNASVSMRRMASECSAFSARSSTFLARSCHPRSSPVARIQTP